MQPNQSFTYCHLCQERVVDSENPLMTFLMDVANNRNGVNTDIGLVFVLDFLQLKAVVPITWSEYRMTYMLNASSIKAAVTYDHFKSAEQLVTDKATAIVNATLKAKVFWAQSEPMPDTDPFIHEKRRKSLHHITRGITCESKAKERFEQTSGHRLLPLFNQTMFTRANLFHGNLAVSPDGITFCGMLFEAKCPEKLNSSGHTNYQHQLQAMMNTLGIEKAVLFQYHVPTGNFLATHVKRDKEWENEHDQSVMTHISRIQSTVHLLTTPLIPNAIVRHEQCRIVYPTLEQ